MNKIKNIIILPMLFIAFFFAFSREVGAKSGKLLDSVYLKIDFEKISKNDNATSEFFNNKYVVFGDRYSVESIGYGSVNERDVKEAKNKSIAFLNVSTGVKTGNSTDNVLNDIIDSKDVPSVTFLNFDSVSISDSKENFLKMLKNYVIEYNSKKSTKTNPVVTLYLNGSNDEVDINISKYKTAADFDKLCGIVKEHFTAYNANKVSSGWAAFDTLLNGFPTIEVIRSIEETHMTDGEAYLYSSCSSVFHLLLNVDVDPEIQGNSIGFKKTVPYDMAFISQDFDLWEEQFVKESQYCIWKEQSGYRYEDYYWGTPDMEQLNEAMIIMPKISGEDCDTFFGSNNVGTYKISDVLVDDNYVSDVQNDAVTFTCSWSFSDGEETYPMQFSTTVAPNKIFFNDFKNIGDFRPLLKFSLSEMAKILNNDEAILSEFENNISAKAPPTISGEEISTAIVLGIGAGIFTFIHAGACAFTAGTSCLATAGIQAGVMTVAVTALALGATAIFKEFVSEPLKRLTNDRDGVVHFYYNTTNGVGDGQYLDVNCYYGETVDMDAVIDSNITVDCETIMGKKFGKILRTILNILRFVACALLVILSVIDFVKPIVSSDAEMLQKSGAFFIKRLIIFVLILFIPAIVELLLSLIGQSNCNV